MIKGLLKIWKEEWWEKQSDSLAQEYAQRERELKEEFKEHLEADSTSFNLKLEEMRKESLELETRILRLQVKKAELGEMERRTDDKKLELSKLNEELLVQIRLIEAKASPSNVWQDAYGKGFQAGMEWREKVGPSLDEKQIRIIKETAINGTLERMNGHHKKNN